MESIKDEDFVAPCGPQSDKTRCEIPSQFLAQRPAFVLKSLKRLTNLAVSQKRFVGSAQW